MRRLFFARRVYSTHFTRCVEKILILCESIKTLLKIIVGKSILQKKLLFVKLHLLYETMLNIKSSLFRHNTHIAE